MANRHRRANLEEIRGLIGVGVVGGTDGSPSGWHRRIRATGTRTIPWPRHLCHPASTVAASCDSRSRCRVLPRTPAHELRHDAAAPSADGDCERGHSPRGTAAPRRGHPCYARATNEPSLFALHGRRSTMVPPMLSETGPAKPPHPQAEQSVPTVGRYKPHSDMGRAGRGFVQPGLPELVQLRSEWREVTRERFATRRGSTPTSGRPLSG
jgi:hypothetical protein